MKRLALCLSLVLLTLQPEGRVDGEAAWYHAREALGASGSDAWGGPRANALNPKDERLCHHASSQLRLTLEQFFEGDIILRPDQDERNLVLPTMTWPEAELPYSFDRGYPPEGARKVEDALRALQRETCVRFVRRTNQRNYVLVKDSGLGCAAEVGYFDKGYATDLHLTSPACLAKPGTIQHEFLHALGFWHEHTRPDRDNYVKIAWSNIAKGKEDNFLARPIDEIQTLGSPYDYGSVMHYPSTAFSKDGISATIIPNNNDALFSIGQRDTYSRVDLAKLNRLYKCAGYYQGS